MLNRSASLAMSTSVLKALPGKLDIKRDSPSILYLYVILPPSERTESLILKAPIATATDDIFCDIFSNFRKYKVWYSMIFHETIFMKYHTLFVIFQKKQKLKLSSAAKCRWRFMGWHRLSNIFFWIATIGRLTFILYVWSKIASEYDQEIPQ